jgi:GT2 family glycosyltransferase
MRISCIIPTLGRSKAVCNITQMLLSQSQPPHEIIVVDQTSVPDDEMRQTLLRTSGSIRWLRQREPNASLARNTGALAATGDIVLFLDDDIKIGRDFLAAYTIAFSDPQVKGVAGQVLEGRGETMSVLPPKAVDSEFGWLYFPKNYTKRCETNWIASGNVAVRRACFLTLGGMDANYTKGAFREESDFAMRFKEKGWRFVFEPAASIYHLGVSGAPDGGSRSWIRNKRIAGWHHCIGDWYFTLRFAKGKSWLPFLRISLRHFVFIDYNVTHPWLLPVLFLRWLTALPVAIFRRMRGPALIAMRDIPTNSCS